MDAQTQIEAFAAPSVEESAAGEERPPLEEHAPVEGHVPAEEPVARVALRDCEDGQRVRGVYAVRERELRRKRNGEPWLRLKVGDASGSAEAVCWEEAEALYAVCATGTAVFVTGVFEVSERWGAKIKLTKLREAEPGEYEPEELATESAVSLELLERDLRALLSTVQGPELRQLLDLFF